MNSKDALELTRLPKDEKERIFVWLCFLNNQLPMRMQLSDKEIWGFVKKLKGGIL